MNLIDKTLSPINGISAIINGGRGSLGAVVSDKGCPPKGQCKGCTPFCCINGQESQLYITKANLGEAGYKIAVAALIVIATACFPPAGIALGVVMAIEEYVLKPFVDWVNFGLNKKTQKEYAIKQGERHVRLAVNQVLAFLQTRLPWCDVISTLQTSPIFAVNSPWFGDMGPNIGKEFVNSYMMFANALNNERYGKTRQKIISVEPYQWDIDEINLHKGVLMVKVPNIEHYWMGDSIILPGFFPVTVIHRYGNSAINTMDCDRVFIDKRIFPDGTYESGRGCNLSYNINTGAPTGDPSMGGRKHGLNIRNMSGEGLLFCSTTYADSHKRMVGQYVDLVNPIYINTDGRVIVPPKSNPSPNPSPSPSHGTNNPIITKTSEITPLKSNTALASFATPITIVALLGIAAGFVYETFKND
ncbi:MAG: hypothetical protein WCK09_20605 [Bacteroidota bacterium]